MIGTSPSITALPLSTLGGGDSGITGFTKNGIGGRRSIRNGRRNIPEFGLVSWALLNGEHVSELLV
jgi:hypothetical protein